MQFHAMAIFELFSYFKKKGVGYYNYGFSNYIVLRELIAQASNGQKDIYQANGDSGQRAAQCAFASLENLMTPNAMAHFGDDHVSVAYEPGIQNYVKSVFARTHNFTNSFLWTDHFTSQVLGYYFQAPDTKKYNLVSKTFAPATGKTKFYNKSGIMISFGGRF